MQIQGETPHQQLEDFRRAMDAIGETHVRGIAFALNGIAMQSHKELMRVLNRVIDKPGAFTKKGLIYRTTPLDTKLEKDLESAVLWLDQQSAYIKYLMGQGDNVRLPGDIGPADSHIFVPIWGNLKRLEGVKPVGGEGLPRSTLKGFARRAGTTLGGARAKVKISAAAAQKQSQVFIGEPVIKGEKQGLGFWSRQKRLTPSAIGPRMPDRAPEMLVAIVDKATYKPILQEPWDEVVNRIWATLPDRLEKELENKLDHIEKKRNSAPSDPYASLPDDLKPQPGDFLWEGPT